MMMDQHSFILLPLKENLVRKEQHNIMIFSSVWGVMGFRVRETFTGLGNGSQLV